MKHITIKTLLFALLISITAAFSLFADDEPAFTEDYSKPAKDEVVIVCKIKLDPPINESFFAQYFYKTIDTGFPMRLVPTTRINKRGIDVTSGPIPSTYSITLKQNANSILNKYSGIFTLDASTPLTGKVKIPKDRILQLEFVTYMIAGIQMFSIDLPFFSEIKIPENTNYVYLGTIVYSYTGYEFKITDINIIDEYDEAVKIVQERYGKDAKLRRIPLNAIKVEE